LPTAVAHAGSWTHDEAGTGFGCRLDYRSGTAVALLEAMERYGGVMPRTGRPIVQGSYADLADRALDPKSLGLYSYDRPQVFGVSPPQYSPDLVLDWVSGYSVRRRKPILVPADCAYYGRWFTDRSSSPPFIQETSNGCAIGASFEEALLHGVLEVLERDAFLLTWYARLPVPEISIASANDRRVPLIAERIEHTTGYAVLAFDTTMEHGIPSFWVMAINRMDDDGRPKALCAAGSHPNQEEALTQALLELGTISHGKSSWYAQNAAKAERMAADPHLVVAMSDHALLYSHPGAFSRFNFLLRAETPMDLSESRSAFSANLETDHLHRTLARLFELGLDVIVVDQTAPEHAVEGLRCVKALVPGMLPMTFGHAARRLDGLPRLLTVPHVLGYRDRPLAPEEVNPYPHPFP
jgi:ribosomal protein S12 methylthiotransferase accessory factor